MNIQRQLRLIRRFGNLSRYIDGHLDHPVTLDDLADIAHMSRYRLDGAFHDYAQETPMSRVWRLRLLRARRDIVASPGRSLLDVALDAGYGSTQAFSRAFARLHGRTPFACRGESPASEPTLRIEVLPTMKIQYVPFAGQRSDVQHASNELRARAMTLGIERHKRFGWMLDVESHIYATDDASRIDLKAGLLDMPIGLRIAGLDECVLPGGCYAVFRFESGIKLPAKQALFARIGREAGWRVADGPWLRRCRNAQYLPSFLEKFFEVYVPVVSLAGVEAQSARDFILEK